MFSFTALLNSCIHKRDPEVKAETANAVVKAKSIDLGDMVLQVIPAREELSNDYYLYGTSPEFIGGLDSLKSFVLSHIYYPQTAIDDNIQGKVYVQFKVDTSGKVIDENIIKSVREDLDTLCLSMVRQMPLWSPALLNGEAIAVQLILPLNFILHSSSEEEESKEENTNSFVSKIFPNPTRDFVNVDLKKENKVTYLLTDLKGKTLLNGQLASIQNKIDLSEYPDGTYILTLVNIETKEKYSSRIIKSSQ